SPSRHGFFVPVANVIGSGAFVGCVKRTRSPGVRSNGVAGLAMEAGGDAEQDHHLAEVAQGAAEVAGGAGLALAAAVPGELGPVERPGLLDGVRLDAADELGVLVDQLEGDRAVGGAV